MVYKLVVLTINTGLWSAIFAIIVLALVSLSVSVLNMF